MPPFPQQPDGGGVALEGRGFWGGSLAGVGPGRHLGEVVPPRPLALPCTVAPEQEAAAAGIPQATPGIYSQC
jgi:hypothetical protein